MGWERVGWENWADHALVRARLEAGADPNTMPGGRPLHRAAQHGSAEVVAELAGRVDDVDVLEEGRSALWLAVYFNRLDNARALAEAGADPWLPMMSGWSPGRLALAGGHDLSGPRTPPNAALSDAEAAVAAESVRFKAVLDDDYDDDYPEEGAGLAAVAGVDVAEVIRRLNATPVDGDPELAEELDVVGATDVPGGCVISQPWGYAPRIAGVMRLLSADTVCYSVYLNPKSGTQGGIMRDGEIVDWDLFPGGEPIENESADQVLLSYLYPNDPMAVACAYAGLRLTDGRAITGPPDVWLRLPIDDYRR